MVQYYSLGHFIIPKDVQWAPKKPNKATGSLQVNFQTNKKEKTWEKKI